MPLPIARLAVLIPVLFAGSALANPSEAATKPVKTVVQAVRYSKDDLALKQFALDAQGAYLLEEQWEKGTPAQRAEFKKLLGAAPRRSGTEKATGRYRGRSPPGTGPPGGEPFPSSTAPSAATCAWGRPCWWPRTETACARS